MVEMWVSESEWVQPFEELLWMLCLGLCVFMESAWLHLHTLQHTSCSFVSCVLHLQHDYQSGSLTPCSAAVDSSSPFLAIDNSLICSLCYCMYSHRYTNLPFESPYVDLCKDWHVCEQWWLLVALCEFKIKNTKSPEFVHTCQVYWHILLSLSFTLRLYFFRVIIEALWIC